MLNKGLSLKEISSAFRGQSISMRRRFVLCLITFLILVVAVLLILFSLFDVTSSANDELEQIFDQQLDYSATQMYKDMDKLAAFAVEFSHQMSLEIEQLDIPFEGLKNNVSALTDLQQNTYKMVFDNMHTAACSGAFFMLNTTVNDSLADTYYNGIYLRYANVGSDITLRNSVCMFRGASAVARQNGIGLFSTWECETKKGTFPQMEAVLNQLESNPAKGYLLTKAYKLPDAWEKVRLLCAPITDKDGRIIGVCGFELSDPFFQSAYQASDAEHKFIISALLEEENGIYTGQFASNHSGYAPNLKGQLSVAAEDRFSVFFDVNMTLIGKAKNVEIGTSEHTVAVMLPEKQYDIFARKIRNKIVLLLLIISLLSLAVSVMISHRYIKPLLNTVERVKAKQFDEEAHILELTDLFAFLADQDRMNEEEISRLRREKTDAVSVADELQSRVDETERQNQRLAYSRKDEIDPYDYENFKNGIKTLTKKEREVFQLYLSGKTAKEIVELLDVRESTLKYHNHNILGKLGVSSRKQMLRFAALMQQENKDSL